MLRLIKGSGATGMHCGHLFCLSWIPSLSCALSDELILVNGCPRSPSCSVSGELILVNGCVGG